MKFFFKIKEAEFNGHSIIIGDDVLYKKKRRMCV